MRILIVNSVALNVGDAAILMGELRALREVFGPDLRIEVAEQTPAVAGRLYPDVAFFAGLHSRHAHWPRWRAHGGVASLRKRRTSLAVRLLPAAPRLARLLLSREQREHLDRIAASDVVVATGGTYFVEHYDFTAKADELLAAQALGKPTFLFTQSMGPFRRERSQRVMRRIVAGSRGVFLRDERSRGHLTEIGAMAERLSVHADAAFALDAPADAGRPTSRPSAAAPSALPPTRVAISVRSWSHARAAEGGDAREDYRRAVAEAARALARTGSEVVFLSTCQGVPEYWTDDSRFAAELVRDLLAGEPGIRVDTQFRSPDALAAELATYDLAIATRMHFAILALVARTPVVAIAYEFKSRELLRSLGMESWAVDFEEVTAEFLARAAGKVLARGPSLRAEIAAHVTGFHADAIQPARLIRERTR